MISAKYCFGVGEERRGMTRMKTLRTRECTRGRVFGPFLSIPLLVGWLCILPGCQPDESPFQVENAALRKQLAKDDSVIQSLQDGNKVMHKQIDLLNAELRDAEKKTQAIEAARGGLATKVKGLTAKNRRLAAEAERARKKLSQMTQNILTEDRGAQTREFLHPLGTTTKVVEATLSRNGYSLVVSVKAERRAVFVTERTISEPAALEMPGFRNQYIVSLHALPTEGTLVTVKADFEKTAKEGRVLVAAPEEVAEIERRLIAEISKSFDGPRAATR